MADKHTKEVRSMNMSHIGSKNTKPEQKVRKYLFSCGLRYRKNVKDLPGSPDIVFPKYRTIVFVNGCFWHGHEGCKYYTVPKTNMEFWINKIRRNRKRDHEVCQRLSSMGWHCITIWECELKPYDRERTLESLAFTLNKIFLQDHSIRRYEIPEDKPIMAAEEVTDEYGKEDKE